jgi:hypothetical protein
MSVKGGPNTVTSGLVLELDAGNIKSYQSGSTTWFDKSGFANNGTLVNGPTFNTGSGGSIVFDGTNDYVTLPSSSNYSYGTADFSVDYWFSINSISSTQQALLDAYSNPNNPTSGGTFGFVITNTQIITYANNGIQFTSPTVSLPTNTWINLTFVRTSGILYIYKDTVLLSSGSCTWDFQFTGNVTQNRPFLYVGINPGAGSFYFNGKIGNIKIYKGKGLTQSEVFQNYNATKTRFGL